MSEENVEIVRRGYEALNQRDVDQFLSYFAPDTEVDFSESIGPFSDVYRGHAEVKTFWESFFEAWEEVRWEIDELRDLGGGDGVLSATHLIARGHGSGIPTTDYRAVIWTARDKRIRRVKFFRDKQDALEAAGLSE
jgi:ketosteroid isomerase-like protein